MNRPRWVNRGLSGFEKRSKAMSWWRTVTTVGVALSLVTIVILHSLLGVRLAAAVAFGAIFLLLGVGVGPWIRLAVSWTDRHDAW
jgi:hypothetical protein